MWLAGKINGILSFNKYENVSQFTIASAPLHNTITYLQKKPLKALEHAMTVNLKLPLVCEVVKKEQIVSTRNTFSTWHDGDHAILPLRSNGSHL